MQINKAPRRPNPRNKTVDKRYHSPRWRRRRLKCLEEANYKCQCNDCTKNKILKLASVADHPIPVTQGGSFWDQKLVAMSESCHAIKSAKERRNIKS